MNKCFDLHLIIEENPHLPESLRYGNYMSADISHAHYSNRLAWYSLPNKTWHHKQERRVIKRHDGKPDATQGRDGKLRGKPVEVKTVRKDTRYRIGESAHKKLVRNNGTYLFVYRNGQSKKISAKQVSEKLGRGR